MANPPFEWIGGDRSLDFHNTVTWGLGVLSEERFRSPENVREWSRDAGFSPPVRSGSLLADTLAFREALHAVFLPIALGRAPGAKELAGFDAFLRRAAAEARLERERRGFRWAFSRAGGLDPVLAEVVWSAAHLLASPEIERLRACANPTCGWLFLDRSRRGNRKWCEMRECGNRAKARRYYRRHRAAKVGSAE